MGSRLLPLGLALAALAAGGAGLRQAALYIGLLAVPPAAGAAFVAVSDVLEQRPALLRAISNGLALTLVVVSSAARENAPHGAAIPPLATYALVAALLAYLAPTVAWVLEPLRIARPPAKLRPTRATPGLRGPESAVSASLRADGVSG